MYILQNQDGYFLAKSGQWVDGREPVQLFRTVHNDEAVNQMFETNSRDFSLRISIMTCEVSSKGWPVIPEDQLPPPLPTEETTEPSEEHTPDLLDQIVENESVAQ